MSKVPVYIILYLTKLCFLWSVPSPVTGEESSDNAIARVVGARNKEDTLWMKVEEDKSADSGWAVDVLRYSNPGVTDSSFHVYMYAKEKYKPSFRHAFFRSVLCATVSKKTKHPKLSFDHFMPTQIMKMIFPGRQGSCTFQKGKKAMKAEGPVNADRNDPKNKDLGIPYSFPFDLMVNVVRVSENDPINAFTFQVNFTVDLVDSKNGGSNVAENLPSIVTDTPINLPARVIGVKNGIENKQMSVVEDSKSPTGWAVKVAKHLRRYIIDWDLRLDLYDMLPTGDKSVRKIFGGLLCDTLLYDSRYNGYPEKNYLPRQIVDFIFPGHMGSCDFEEGTIAMKDKGSVNLNPFENPDVKLPYSPYYNLIANVRPKKYANESPDVYFFQVNFTVGEPDFAKILKDPRKCQDDNSATLQRPCEGYKAIKSTVSKNAKQIMQALGQ